MNIENKGEILGTMRTVGARYALTEEMILRVIPELELEKIIKNNLARALADELIDNMTVYAYDNPMDFSRVFKAEVIMIPDLDKHLASLNKAVARAYESGLADRPRSLL